MRAMQTQMMSRKQEFDTQLVKVAGAAVIYLPFDAQEVFGGTNVHVKGLIDSVPYRSVIFNSGGKTFMVVSKPMRLAIGKESGDEVHVVMDLDSEE